jgi:S-formylglutathione hydrolase FrmB
VHFRRALAVALLALPSLLLVSGLARADRPLLSFDLANKNVGRVDALTGIPAKDTDRSGPTGLRMWVSLPAGYTPDHCWPVLYLLHGSGLATEWTDTQALYAGLPAIVVIPGGGDSQYTDWYNGGKRSPRWERWFFDDVMGTVAQHFPICAGRSQHAIAGTSMGGGGAYYLASQRPDYFGAAGAFSGVPLDLGSPIIQLGFNAFSQVWGPPNGFYAQGHDPKLLVGNLRNTRLFLAYGDGNPFDTADVDPGQGHIVEVVAGLQATSFVPAAQKAGVRITVEQHAGIHTPPNFDDSLARMLRWNPFAPVTEHPTSWTQTTVSQQGVAWGYSYKMKAPPMSLVRLSFGGGELRVEGKGTMTLRPPDGGVITTELPFALRDGTVRKLSSSNSTVKVGAMKLPVSLGLAPWTPSRSQPVIVRFRTDRALTANETYQIIAREQDTNTGCFVTNGVRIRAPHKRQRVSVRMKPGRTQGHPQDRWCKGNGHMHVLIVPRASKGIQLGDYLGTATFRVHG